ncbi:MAG TPA: flagellar biosynthetic protein FliO [Solirubrobacteraceae bacterium]|jgi:flagellar protein FliO/FliZ|nr:flagellar biosynthetic protein FliO [Solirubrobacteraceae bacterium]
MTKPIPPSRAAAQAAAVLGACLLAFACPASAPAATGAKASGENTPLNLSPSSTGTHTTSTGGASIVRTIVGLAIVIAVIWGLAWIMRQVKAGRDPQVSTAGLASVAQLTLGSGRSVHLVRAGNDYVLLGAAEQGLVPIHRYTEAQAREAGLPMLDEPPPRPRRALLRPAQPAEPRVGPTASEQRWGGSATDGHRPNPMDMPSPAYGLLERVREWTVRR